MNSIIGVDPALGRDETWLSFWVKSEKDPRWFHVTLPWEPKKKDAEWDQEAAMQGVVIRWVRRNTHEARLYATRRPRTRQCKHATRRQRLARSRTR